MRNTAVRSPHYSNTFARAILCALCFTAVCTFSARAEKAMLLPRTSQTGSNATNSFLQRGGLLSLDLGDDNNWSIGFWVKRYFGDSQYDGSSSTDDGVIFGLGLIFSSYPEALVKTKHLPSDESWHYVRIDCYSGNYFRTWVDNVQVISTNMSSYCSFGSCPIACYFGADGTISKKATLTSLLLDDIMVWKNINTNSGAYHTNIWKYGMSAFNAADADVKAYYSFDSTTETGGTYYQDYKAMDNTTDMTAQNYSMTNVTMTLVDGSTKPSAYVKITIDSDYALSKITPTPDSTGIADVLTGALTTFTAPRYVYLDRYGNELAGTAEDISDNAYYRMVNDGYSAAGDTVQGTPMTSFTLTTSNNMTVSWFWKKQYAVIVDSSTANIEGVSDTDFSGLGDPSPYGITKTWVDEDTIFNTAIDGIINQSNAPVRFASTGYTIENAPDVSDRYMVFSGTNTMLSFSNTIPLLTLGDFTIEFWAKRDSRTTTSDEDIFSVGEGSGSPKLLRVGFRSSANTNAMFIANTNGSVIASVDGAFTDDEWHHWAWVYKSSSSFLELYRDGKSLGTFTKSITWQSSAATGAAYQYYKGIAYYSTNSTNGTIQTGSAFYEAESANVLSNVTVVTNLATDNGNSVQFNTTTGSIKWTNLTLGTVDRLLSVRTLASGSTSRTLSLYVNGVNKTNFSVTGGWVSRAIEVSLTNGSTIELQGSSASTNTLYVDQIVLWAETNITSLDTIFSTYTLNSTGTNSTFLISPTNQPDHIAFKYTTKLYITNSGSYTFRTASDDGSRLYVDGLMNVTNDGVHGTTTVTGNATNLTTGFHDVQVEYYDLSGGESLSVTYSGPDTSNSYTAIPTNSLYTSPDSVAIGAAVGASNYFKGGVNNLRLWNTARTSSQISESMTNSAYGATNTLAFEVNFDSPSTTTIYSSQNYIGSVRNVTNLFPSGTSTTSMTAALFPAFTWTQMTNILGRIQTGSVTVQDWIRLTWLWQRQYRVRLSATETDYQGLPFVVTTNGTYTGTAAQEVWVPEYSSVTVGTQYRTDDRCHTLSRIVAQTGALTPITMDNVVDGTLNSRATRQYTINYLTNYGDIMFTYARTIFRAEIPLGKGLNVSNTTVLNTQIVPDICSGASLKLTATPTVANSAPEINDGATSGKSGRQVLFDKVGKQLIPLAPGAFRVEWPDANDPTTSYLIEVVSDFPGETLNLYYDREDESGYRYSTNNGYVRQVTFGNVSDEFPASPNAHYRHFYDASADAAPVDLDPNTADRWHFDEVTYSTDNALVIPNTSKFSATTAGKAVALFSYTSAATSVATGDAAREAYVTRVIESISSTNRTQTSATLSKNNRYAVQFTNNAALSPSPNGAGFLFGSTTVTRDFWYKAESAPATPTSDQVIYYENGLTGDSTANYKTAFGIRSTTNTTNAAGFYFSVASRLLSGSTNYTDVLAIDLTDIPQDYAWHHWALVRNGSTFQIYRDGLLVANKDCSAVSTYSNGVGPYIGGNSLTGISSGQLDNYRLWSASLTADQVRSSMLTAAPTFLTNSLAANVTFDDGMQTKTTVIGSITNTIYYFTNLVSSSGYLYFIDSSATNFVVQPNEDAVPEVATRLYSKLDTAGLESGYITHRVSNYNPDIYDRTATPGAWGPIYPVNWGGIFTNNNEFEVVWYENPYQSMPASSTTLHPNVNWPYVIVSYDEVAFPKYGANKENRIYIASRLGTEGVDASGNDQLVFNPASYSGLTVYNQPDPTACGYNPNEEHALVAPSIKDQLTGDTLFNLSQDAAFALQNRLNNTNTSTPSTYTSEPWVLVQYENLSTGDWEMAAYKVEKTRTGTATFPALDSTTHLPTDSLGQPVAQPTNPTYDFSYTTFAGDVLIPPYPLNLVIGNIVVSKNWGGQLSTQRTLWKDINGNYWTVSGDGSFFFRYWYPFRSDFWYDTNHDGANDVTSGTYFSWLPSDGIYKGSTSTNSQIIRYSSYWRTDYPVLKRGETLTYAGGEYKAENSTAEGLPAIVGFAAAQVVYDSARPEMVFDSSTINKYSARIVRPLEKIAYSLAQSDMPTPLTPAYSDNVMVVGSRWYFKALTGSLQKRFYYDSLSGQLIFRGRLNDLESGDPDLTATPVATYVLEPNVLTAAEYRALKSLPSSTKWSTAIDNIYRSSQDPNGIGNFTLDAYKQYYYAGMESSSGATVEQPGYYSYASGSDSVTVTNSSSSDVYQHINSLGSGAALVPNSSFLTNSSTNSAYITVAENNNADAGGAISLHIIRIGEERYRGSIKLVEAQNVFDEKVNLKHAGDFGGNTENIYYQWWVHDVANLNDVGLPGEDVGWQVYKQGLNLNMIEFSGRPDVMLADKLFYVRYGESNELRNVSGVVNVVTNDTGTASVDDNSWRLVDFTDDTWSRSSGAAIPHQWGGAANSPQAQSDGSKKYIPQLVMGWVKRVLDRVNPYEARYTDFYNNTSPATYGSMIEIAGKPYIGKVALNSDKDVLENVGLIELYETVLARAKELTLDVNGGSTSGTDQALLLAATRLAFLYELLAREAYSDAQNPLIRVTDANGQGSYAPYVFAFYNQQASLLDEELALLRGTDFVKAYPSYNRLFWNYVKGEGEAAYNANYNIYDVNKDGFIDEYDAATLYPQGHGDAWGHFLSANSMHYELLKHAAFDWESRSELYSLLDNVVKADYLDEKSFARIAAAKARTGLETVRATYRKAYTENPDGQWQGYTDTDTSRAWGVSEWAKRTGQAALFDWIVGNALVPPLSTNNVLDDIDRIDRSACKSELSEIAGTTVSIQCVIDEANAGMNPIGLDRDAVSFDLDPLQYDGIGGTRNTHFEQAYAKAITAAQNARVALDAASKADYQLQKIANDTLSLQTEALRQDIDYKNRLIEIFGTPYTGTIGTGKVFDEGYTGPDTLLYLYIDRTDTADLIPGVDTRYYTLTNSTYTQWANNYKSLDWDPNFAEISDKVKDLFNRYYLTDQFAQVALGESTNTSAQVLSINAPVRQTSDYAFQADSSWGSRTAYGRIQTILGEMLQEQVAMEKSVRDYAEFIEQAQILSERLKVELRVMDKKESVRSSSTWTLVGLNIAYGAAAAAEGYYKWLWDSTWQGGIMLSSFFPTVNGFDNDLTSAPRGAVQEVAFDLDIGFGSAWLVSILAKASALAGIQATESMAAADETVLNEFREMNAVVSELGTLLTQEQSKRLAISGHVQQMELLSQKLQSAKAEGFRLLDEREAFNKILASKAQGNRYRDMVLRLARNEALTQYQDAFNNAQRYAWLAAKAYDYETSLNEGDPAAATSVLQEIVKCRTLGLWENGQPRIGEGGLANQLARMKANFDNLKGQLGINNPQIETDRLSLRHEHFRIATNSFTSDTRWKQTLQAARVDDLWQIPEYVKYCRPFSTSGHAEPGIVLEFSTEINSGKNVFGQALGGADHAYSSANYATKIRSMGVWFENYNSTGLSTSPRVYLVPVGSDVLRVANASEPTTRSWNLIEQRVPVPFVINASDLSNPDYIPSLKSLDGSFAEIRRFGDFRAYHTGGETSIDSAQLATSSRLIGRSVWNTRWLLIIPGATLHSDTSYGLKQFVNGVTDIKLVFQTYTHEGN